MPLCRTRYLSTKRKLYLRCSRRTLWERWLSASSPWCQIFANRLAEEPSVKRRKPRRRRPPIYFRPSLSQSLGLLAGQGTNSKHSWEDWLRATDLFIAAAAACSSSASGKMGRRIGAGFSRFSGCAPSKLHSSDVLVIGNSLTPNACRELAKSFRVRNPQGKIIEILVANWDAPMNEPDTIAIGPEGLIAAIRQIAQS